MPIVIVVKSHKVMLSDHRWQIWFRVLNGLHLRFFVNRERDNAGDAFCGLGRDLLVL